MPVSHTDTGLAWRRPHSIFGPLEQVRDMVSGYESIREPSQALRYINSNSKLYVLFCELIEHHVGMIKSRPQSIQEGYVTIYDKCLLELCRSGDEVHRLAAQECFIRDFMGIDTESLVCEDAGEALDKDIFARGLFVGCSRTRSLSERRKVKKEQLNQENFQEQEAKQELLTEKSKGEERSTAPSHVPTPQSQIPPPFSETDFDSYGTVFARNYNINTNVRRMLEIYFKAKSDFYRISSSSQDQQQRADAAKFLRDSAENALDYIRSQDLFPLSSEKLTIELQVVFKYAKSKAIELLGGRKRRFEIEPRYNKNKSSSLPSTSSVAATTASRSIERSEGAERDLARPQIRRVAADRYFGAAPGCASQNRHLWQPYDRYKQSRSRSGFGRAEKIGLKQGNQKWTRIMQ